MFVSLYKADMVSGITGEVSEVGSFFSFFFFFVGSLIGTWGIGIIILTFIFGTSLKEKYSR